MPKRHTTGPIQPIARIEPVAPISLHRLSIPARLAFAEARRFYQNRLRALKRARKDQS